MLVEEHVHWTSDSPSQVPAIQLIEVRKDFATPNGTVQNVVNGISLDVQDGELVCLLGPTGCGKSTILNLVAGFETPTAGRITVYGNLVTGPSRDRVVVFQDAGSALFGWRTISENVEYPLRLRGVQPARTRLAMCRDLLALVHLDADGHKFPHQLSGGGKQRAQIARALAADPKILLMDEPLAALDALTKMGLQREVVGLVTKTRKTILYVTHDIIESALISDRVIVLSRGPSSVIRYNLPNPIPHPRSPGDEAVGKFIRMLEEIVLTSDAVL